MPAVPAPDPLVPLITALPAAARTAERTVSR